jgi:phytol kinase
MLSELAAIAAVLAVRPWIATGIIFGLFLLLVGTLQRSAARVETNPETTRKILHVGSGMLTVTFPFVFVDVWPVLLLTAASGALLAAARFAPAIRSRVGNVAHRVERATCGELYFPVAIAVLFWRTHGQHPLLFVIPVLILTLADAAAAVIGARYGRASRDGKSLAGSIAFAVVAFVCAHVALLAWPEVGRGASFIVAGTIAVLVTFVERAARRGLDNLLVPFASYLLLRGLLAGVAA